MPWKRDLMKNVLYISPCLISFGQQLAIILSFPRPSHDAMQINLPLLYQLSECIASRSQPATMPKHVSATAVHPKSRNTNFFRYMDDWPLRIPSRDQGQKCILRSAGNLLHFLGAGSRNAVAKKKYWLDLYYINT